MANEITVDVNMDLGPNKPVFEERSSNGEVKLLPNGNLSVPFGECAIEFLKGGSERDLWDFAAIRLKTPPAVGTVSIAMERVVEDSILLLDSNDNMSRSSEYYFYQIQVVELATGLRYWIDPVVENQSGQEPRSPVGEPPVGEQ